MISKKQFLILLAVTAVVFLGYGARASLIGFDSYHFLGIVCGFDEARDEAPLFIPVLEHLPCDILTLKAVLFCLCFASVFFLSLTGNLFDEKHGWLAGLFAFLSFVFVIEFLKFENDQFALPFLFAAAYFLFKSYKREKFKWVNQAIAIFLLLVGAGFWGGAILYLVVLSFFPGAWLFRAITPVLIYFFHGNLLGALFGMGGVMENTPFVGFVGFIFLLPGLPALRNERKLWLPIAVLMVLAALVPKFGLFLIPFLTVALMLAVKENARAREMFFLMAVCMSVGMIIPIFMQVPTQEMFDSVAFAVEQSPEIQNDWQLGYVVKYYGGKTKYFASPDPPFLVNPGIVVSKKNLKCDVLKEFGAYAVYNC